MQEMKTAKNFKLLELYQNFTAKSNSLYSLYIPFPHKFLDQVPN